MASENALEAKKTIMVDWSIRTVENQIFLAAYRYYSLKSTALVISFQALTEALDATMIQCVHFTAGSYRFNQEISTLRCESVEDELLDICGSIRDSKEPKAKS